MYKNLYFQSKNSRRNYFRITFTNFVLDYDLSNTMQKKVFNNGG